MATTMKAVMLTKKGGPEVLEVVELPLPTPGPGEVRVTVEVTGVGSTDVTMRTGYYPYAPPVPFVPGYESIGVVDAIGPGVTSLSIGDRVCALLVHGGYATHVVRGAEHWVKVPKELDAKEAVSLVLNYVTAYQMLVRTAGVRAGQTVLVNGANGGVGQALLDLCRALDVKAIGAASRKRHDVVRAYGATPIDGRGAPLDEGVHAVRPEGVEASFDGVGGAQTGQCIAATRRGGTVVWYGFAGTGGLMGTVRSAAALFAGAPLRGRSGKFYGITQLYREDPKPFHEDLAVLFALLGAKKIRPLVAETMGILEARRANERLEAGNIEGKVLLVADR